MLSRLLIAAVALAGVFGILWFARRFFGSWNAARRQAETEDAMRQFRMQRELLEAKFYDLPVSPESRAA